MEAPTTHTRWVLVCIATVAGFTAAFNVGKVAPTLSLLESEFELNLIQTSLIVSSFGFMTMIFAFPIALVSSHYRAYRVMLVALALMGLGALGSSQSDAFYTLLLFRIIEGIGYVLIAVTAPALISEVTLAKNRAAAMAIWSTWVPIGVSIMLLTSPLLLTLHGWRSVWLFASVVAFIWMIVVATSFYSHQRNHHENNKLAPPDLAGVFKRSPLMLAASFTCYSIIFNISVSMMPTVWLKTKSVPVDISSWWLSLLITSGVIGNFIGGWLVTKGVSISKVLASSFVISTCLGGVAFIDSVPYSLQLVCMGGCIFLGGILPGTIFAVIPSYAKSPEQVSLIVGLIMQGTGAGLVVGPVIFGFVINAFDENWSLGFWFFTVVAVIGGIIMLNIKPPNNEIV